MFSTEGPRHIGLALSGGGMRAAAFHGGVILWLAERNMLESVEHISSVSGGSLFTGMVFHFSDYRWPTSTQYINEVLPRIRNLLTKKSLQRDAVFRLLFNPMNWQFFLSRANVIAQSIEKHWGIKETLDRLPRRPVWSINGTTAETGRRFRFKGTTLGDYEIGYAEAKNYPLAAAMGVSAAFPGGIGPLRLDVLNYQWHKRELWDSTQSPDIVKLGFDVLHLYDGGVYDNLGIEPLFDMGEQALKKNSGMPSIDFIVVSDAGASLSRSAIPGPLSIGRLKRVADIAFDQARALRIRSYVNYLQSNTHAGLYVQIGSDPMSRIAQYSQHCDIGKNQKMRNWLSSKKTVEAASHKTTLSRMREIDFDLILRHGYETALWNELVFLA